jgi:hypothetical protein
MDIADVNFLTVIAGAIVMMALGAMWYSPVLFGNMWLAAIGKKPEDIQADSSIYAFPAIAALVTAFVLSLFAHAIYGDPEILEGVLVGVIAAAGISVTATLVYSVFEGPPLKVWLIYSGHQLLGLALIGAIVTL